MENENSSQEDQSQETSQNKKAGNFLRRNLITGFVIIIPLWLAFFVSLIIFNWVSNFTFPIVNHFVSEKQWVVFLAKVSSFFLSVLIVFLLGFFTNKVLGRSVLNFFERIIQKLPLIGTVYFSAKQFINFIFAKEKDKGFKKVIFIPYPNKTTYSVAFLTNSQMINNERYVCAFMPTTPNPTTGFLLMYKEEDIIHTNYSIDQAFQFIISVGVITMDRKQSKIQDEVKKHFEELKK